MRTCPQCGFTEPVMWRLSRFDPEQERADAYEVQEKMPELAGLLEEGKDVRYGLYVYRLRRGGRSVVRLEAVIYDARGRMHGESSATKRTFDRYQHRMSYEELRKQQKLSEVLPK